MTPFERIEDQIESAMVGLFSSTFKTFLIFLDQKRMEAATSIPDVQAACSTVQISTYSQLVAQPKLQTLK